MTALHLSHHGPHEPADREAVEDLLRGLLDCEYRSVPATEAHLSGLGGRTREATLHALATAKARDLAVDREDGWHLTPAGRNIAVRIMRAHRLIETRLARQSGLPPARWHDVAHATEHRLTSGEINRLADSLDNPRFDPHGDPIPTREGTLPHAEGCPLLAWPAGTPAVVIHVEDEPPQLFARLAGDGLFAGVRLCVHAPARDTCQVEVEGRVLTLSLEEAALVGVRALHPGEEPPPSRARRLADIPPGSSAEVLTLLPGCTGAERARLLDLGFVPGSRVEHALDSPFNGPAAWRVRGTLVALRREQAAHILVLPAGDTGT